MHNAYCQLFNIRINNDWFFIKMVGKTIVSIRIRTDSFFDANTCGSYCPRHVNHSYLPENTKLTCKNKPTFASVRSICMLCTCIFFHVFIIDIPVFISTVYLSHLSVTTVYFYELKILHVFHCLYNKRIN